MIYEIPTTHTGPSWTQETALDGVTYRLTFRWNAREEYWYLTISDLDDVVLASGLKLVPGAALLRHLADFTKRPPGELIVLGTPMRDSLSAGDAVFYADADEVG